MNFPNENISQINLDGKTYRNAYDITQVFNNYCIDQVQQSSNLRYTNTRSNSSSSSMFMMPTIPHDTYIYQIIQNLKNTSSTGYDNICTKIVNQVSMIIAPILSHVINLCITQGTFPDKLKVSIIKPLFKKHNKEDVSCYRPIALVPIFSKVFEKVIIYIITK